MKRQGIWEHRDGKGQKTQRRRLVRRGDQAVQSLKAVLTHLTEAETEPHILPKVVLSYQRFQRLFISQLNS